MYNGILLSHKKEHIWVSSHEVNEPRAYCSAWSKSEREKQMAPHSSTLTWRIPWTEEPGRLQSMGSLRVGQDWATSLSLSTFMHWRRKWQPTPVFLPGESQGQGSLVGCCLWGRTESDTTEVTWQQQQLIKNLPAMQETRGLIPGLGRSPQRRKWLPTPIFLPGESHGQRSLTAYGSWDHKCWTWLSD